MIMLTKGSLTGKFGRVVDVDFWGRIVAEIDAKLPRTWLHRLFRMQPGNVVLTLCEGEYIVCGEVGPWSVPSETH